MQSLVETQKELNVQQSRSHEAEAAIAAITEERAQSVAEFRRTLSSDLVEAERKAAGLREDLIKAEQRTRLQLLTTPVDGTVQQLAVHTVGGVVTPAQALLVVVPADSHLEIEAMVSNRDIGFVHVGQEAKIKVDTFNFTRYGLLHGRVMSVSQDAIARDKPREQSDDKPPGAESRPGRNKLPIDPPIQVATDIPAAAPPAVKVIRTTPLPTDRHPSEPRIGSRRPELLPGKPPQLHFCTLQLASSLRVPLNF